MSSSKRARPVCGRLNRQFKSKPRAFIIFTDLDGTFTPIGLEGLKDFADVVKEITERENVQVGKLIRRLGTFNSSCNDSPRRVQVKFVPVSGRPCGYVLRVLHSVRDVLKGARAKQ